LVMLTCFNTFNIILIYKYHLFIIMIPKLIFFVPETRTLKSMLAYLSTDIYTWVSKPLSKLTYPSQFLCFFSQSFFSHLRKKAAQDIWVLLKCLHLGLTLTRTWPGIHRWPMFLSYRT
jgi:hypothetical protein